MTLDDVLDLLESAGPDRVAEVLRELSDLDLQWLHDVCHLRGELDGLTLQCARCDGAE